VALSVAYRNKSRVENKFNLKQHPNKNDRCQAWYAEFLLEIDLKILLRKNRSKIELQDRTYMSAY
jgi:hypothetical protein